MPKIIQFLHTAVEAKPVNAFDNIIPWNNNTDHRRKFLLSSGKFVNNDEQEEKNELVFWGEWEAQSYITRITRGDDKPPKYLNKPFIDPTVSKRTHNTDPNVFGERFKYIICKQTFFHNVLTNLEEKSIILFGSSIDGQFCLDTVFVVSNIKPNYTLISIETLFPKQKWGQYYHASVNPIYDDTQYNSQADNTEDFCRISDEREYTYYESVDFSEREKYNNIYSFVPCIEYDGANPNRSFRQPIIKLDFIKGGQTMGVNSKNCSTDEISEYWNSIVEQIEEAGLKKGTFFKTPELFKKE